MYIVIILVLVFMILFYLMMYSKQKKHILEKKISDKEKVGNIGSFKPLYVLDYSKSKEHNFNAELGIAYGYEKVTPIPDDPTNYINEQLTIYIYPYPHPLDISIEEHHEFLLQEFGKAYNDIIAFNSSQFDINSEPPEGVVEVNGKKYYYVYNTRLQLRNYNEKKESYLCLFITHGAFVKIRYTSKIYRQESINEVLEYFSKFMSSERTKMWASAESVLGSYFN